MGELRKLPGVGKQTEEDLIMLGYPTIESLKNADPQAIYDKECAMRGQKIDRCVLYIYRCAVYYASNEQHDPELLKWWNHKDKKTP